MSSPDDGTVICREGAGTVVVVTAGAEGGVGRVGGGTGGGALTVVVASREEGRGAERMNVNKKRGH